MEVATTNSYHVGLCTWAGYALPGTRGAVLGFLLGILGVVIAAIIGKK